MKNKKHKKGKRRNVSKRRRKIIRIIGGRRKIFWRRRGLCGCRRSRRMRKRWRRVRSNEGRAIAQAVSLGVPPRQPGFEPTPDRMGFVVDKVALG
jgi:hypothetical protein